MRSAWTRTHATQPEILSYIRAAIERFGIEDCIRYGQDVRSIVWSDEARRYTVTLACGEH